MPEVPVYDPAEPEDNDYIQTFGTGSISTLPEDEEKPAPRLPFGFGVHYASVRNATLANVRNRHRNTVPRRQS